MKHIEVLFRTIFALYFSDANNCLVLVRDERSDLDLQFNMQILSIKLGDMKKMHALFGYNGCQEFLLDVDHPVEVLQNIEHEIQLHPDRFNRRRYIVLSDNNHWQDVFESKAIEYISDLLVIAEDPVVNGTPKALWEQNHSIFHFWTHRYVGRIGTSTPYLLDTWHSANRSFVFNNNLFPNKISDQHGRILKVAVFSYEPYVIVKALSDSSYLYEGSEMKTMLTFAEHHNMTIQPVINEANYWGEIWENGSGNGLLGNLVEDHADIGGGALYTWEYAYKALDLTKPTVRTGVTCLVPAPKLGAGWLTPIYAYAKQTWAAVMGTFVLSFLLLCIVGLIESYKCTAPDTFQLNRPRIKPVVVDRYRTFSRAMISVSKPFLMQTLTTKETNKSLLGRYTMGLVFMTALVLSITYDSGLATIMTVPTYDNPINTVDEFVASGLHWGATQNAWITSIEGAKELNLMKIVSRFLATTEANLRDLSLTGKFAFSIERLPNGNYAIGSYIQKDVIHNYHLMSHDFYWEHCVLMLRKNSILLPYVDLLVLRVFEAGLISVWQNEATAEHMDQFVQKAVRYYFHHEKEMGIVKLKLLHVEGAFAILGLGSAAAFLVFLVELIPRLIHYREIPFIRK